MKELGVFVFTALACIGICVVLGLCTRHTEKDEKNRDDIILTLGRGFGLFVMISTVISILVAIIYLIAG